MGELAVTKLADHFLAKAMSEPASAKLLPNALKTGNVSQVASAVKSSDPYMV